MNRKKRAEKVTIGTNGDDHVATHDGRINREVKDRLFKKIFGTEEARENILSLYNAMNGSNYTDASLIEFTTIEDAVYMGVKNDVSFLFNDEMNIFEQQSTFNPNMPARMFVYSGHIYGDYMSSENTVYNQYSSKLQKLPRINPIVFYIGSQSEPEEIIMKLSDAFEPGNKPMMEFQVRMLNINRGNNHELLEKCKPLRDYSNFVHFTRERNADGKSIEESVDYALDMLDDGWVKSYIRKNRSEVMDMVLSDYDEERTMRLLKDEYREEGQENATTNIILNIMGLHNLSFDAAADYINLKGKDRENCRKAVEAQKHH